MTEYSPKTVAAYQRWRATLKAIGEDKSMPACKAHISAACDLIVTLGLGTREEQAWLFEAMISPAESELPAEELMRFQMWMLSELDVARERVT